MSSQNSPNYYTRCYCLAHTRGKFVCGRISRAVVDRATRRRRPAAVVVGIIISSDAQPLRLRYCVIMYELNLFRVLNSERGHRSFVIIVCSYGGKSNAFLKTFFFFVRCRVLLPDYCIIFGRCERV